MLRINNKAIRYRSYNWKNSVPCRQWLTGDAAHEYPRYLLQGKSVHPLIENEPDRKALLLGNEAIVRGALEASVAVATGYPGTPASEVGDTFARIARQRLLHFEYSVNEKVAYEVAYGACLGGVRSICSMKHLGLNVAADPLVTSAYIGVRGGFVIVSAADPGCHTSPNEQDHRYLARMSYIPVLDPEDPAEALAMTREGFAISERFNVPVLMRHTTRVAHTQGPVTLGELPPVPEHTSFVRDPGQLVPVPASARRERQELIQRIARAAEQFESSPFNRLTRGEGTVGIVTTGVSHAYVQDAIEELGLAGKVWVLKLGIPYPLATGLVRRLLEGCETVLVVEEMEPFLEDAVRVELASVDRRVRVRGKNDAVLPVAGEYGPALVREALARVAGVDAPPRPAVSSVPDLPRRPPLLCAGCPHRASYTAVNMAVDERAVFMNDIGCYTLGLGQPLDTADLLLSMGSSLPQGSGIWAATGRRSVAFIGDSTFFHSGMTGLVNAAYNRHDLMVMVLDNHITGMTGHQPNPSMALTGMGEVGEEIAIDEVARACGADHVVVVDPRDQRATEAAVRQAYHMQGLRVVVSRAPCPVHEARTKGRPERYYRIEQDRCSVCHLTGQCDAACHMGPQRSLSLLRAGKRTRARPAGTASGPAPCTASCPVNLCIQGFLGSFEVGEIREAYRIIREELPLPRVVSRVCPRPCESACVRERLDGAVAINDVKRTITDMVTGEDREAVRELLLQNTQKSGRKVAVVGAGPAGLAAASDLAVAGHDVTIFEASDRAGGLLSWAIPAFRLPSEVIEDDVGDVLALGPRLQTGRALGRDFTLQDLLDQGHEAVFLGVGAGAGWRLGMEGEDAQGVYDVIDLLRRVRAGERPSVGPKAVVIGGGDSAVDGARTALRLGAEAVAILYRRTRREMGASDHEIRIAASEGVLVEQKVVPVEVLVDGGKVRGLVCRRTRMGDPDESGRPRPLPVQGSEFEMVADTVIVATGQRGVDARQLGLGDLVQVTPEGRIQVDPITGATSHPSVFAGGDGATGPSTVVQSIASGRTAARAMDCLLRGDPLPTTARFATASEASDASSYVVDDPQTVERMETDRLDPGRAVRGFDEVEKGADEDRSVREASRCFACATCGRCDTCIVAFGCPAFYRDETGSIRIDPVLCTGCGVCATICPNGAIVAVEDSP